MGKRQNKITKLQTSKDIFEFLRHLKWQTKSRMKETLMDDRVSSVLGRQSERQLTSSICTAYS